MDYAIPTEGLTRPDRARIACALWLLNGLSPMGIIRVRWHLPRWRVAR